MERKHRVAIATLAICLLAAPLMAQVPVGGEKPQEPNQQSDLPPLDAPERSLEFFSGTKFNFKPRAYEMYRDRDAKQDNVGLALGGSFQYQSGFAFERLQLRATVYGSQVLYGPPEKDGTLLFLPGPASFAVVGEANAVLRVTDNSVVRAGRQLFELPYLGSHDIRMVPNTFEAVTYGNASPTGFAYVVAYVSKIKLKNSDTFKPMSEAAGVEGGKGGVSMAGARYISGGNEVLALNQYTPDAFNTLFTKFERTFALSANRSLKAGVQYTDQRSVGKELIDPFTTGLLAAKTEYSWSRTTLRFGVSTTGDEKGIQKPYGNPANYLSVIVEDFDRAGENAWMIGGNQGFGRVGPGELSLFGNIVSGRTPNTGPVASPDENEYDLTVDYRIKEGRAKNLWLRLRSSFVNQDEEFGGDDFYDLRLIINWDFSIR